MTKFQKLGRGSGSYHHHRPLAIMDYRNTTAIYDDNLKERIIRAYNKTKNNIGYCTYSLIYKETRIPYSKIFSILKGMHNQAPRSIHFNVDRMGHNVFFKLDR